MVGTFALLKYSVIYMNVKQGSSSDRGQSPAEWGEIPSVSLSVHPPPQRLEPVPGRPKPGARRP